METNKRRKRAAAGLRCSAFLIVFALLLNLVSVLFMPKHGKAEDGTVSYITKGYLGEPENTLDMIAVGNSDLYRGLSPMELWNSYGITGYVSGEPMQKMVAAYRIVKGALKRHNPKVVVLEVDSVYNKTNESTRREKKRQPLPALYRGVARDLKDGTYSDGIGTAIGYLFPVVKYHARWSDLERGELAGVREGRHYAGKGFVMGARVQPYTRGFDYMKPTAAVEKMDKVTAYYLEKIVMLCKREKVQVILLELPSASSWSYAKHNGIAAFAQKHGLPFYDFNLEASQFGFDWTTDTKDGGDHLNLSGAEKASLYFGQILRDTYGLPDRRNDPAYRHWEEDAQVYFTKKREQRLALEQEAPGVDAVSSLQS